MILAANTPKKVNNAISEAPIAASNVDDVPFRFSAQKTNSAIAIGSR